MTRSIRLLFEREKKTTYFSYVFYSFSYFLCQKSELLPSIFTLWSFLKFDRIDSLSFDLWKTLTIVNRSRWSLKRSTVSKFILSIFKKDWREGFDHFHNQIDLSITKNRAIWLKNGWLNFQPWHTHTQPIVCLFPYSRSFYNWAFVKILGC